jgi:hypothetical protein
MKRPRNGRAGGILKLAADDPERELEFELAYLRGLTTQERFALMFRNLGNMKIQDFLECLDGEAGVTHDTAHGAGIDGIMARDGQNADAVSHDNVLGWAGRREVSREYGAGFGRNCRPV